MTAAIIIGESALALLTPVWWAQSELDGLFFLRVRGGAHAEGILRQTRSSSGRGFGGVLGAERWREAIVQAVPAAAADDELRDGGCSMGPF